MKTHRFWGNKYVSSTWVRVKNTIKKTLAISALFIVASWFVTAGIIIARYTVKPVTVYGKEIVEVPVSRHSPVMDRIMHCESGGNHLDPKTGQVYMLANTNKTVDVGKYMLNSVWHKKAKELGFDITKEEDNEKMAYWIYENIGTSPWVYTMSCWAK